MKQSQRRIQEQNQRAAKEAGMPAAPRSFDCEIAGTSKPGQPGDDFGWCLLRFAGGELMLNTAYDDDERPATPDPVRIASHSDTTLYFACQDLDGAYRHLRESGIEANEPKVAYYDMKQVYFKDPDGFGICLQWPAAQKTHDQGVQAHGIQTKEVGGF